MGRLLFSNRVPLLAVAAHGGGRRSGPPRMGVAVPDDEPEERLEEWYERLRELRDLLLAACGGCEDTLDFFYDVAGRSKTFDQLALQLGLSNRGSAKRESQKRLRELGKILVLSCAAHNSIVNEEPGFTLHPRSAKFVNVNKWAVSLAGLSRAFPALPSLVETTRYVADRREFLFGRDELYLGGWTPSDCGGDYNLEVTRLFPGDALTQALAFAVSNSQYAIFNLHTEETIVVGETERRAA